MEVSQQEKKQTMETNAPSTLTTSLSSEPISSPVDTTTTTTTAITEKPKNGKSKKAQKREYYRQLNKNENGNSSTEKREKKEVKPIEKNPNDPLRWRMISPFPSFSSEQQKERKEEEEFRVLTFNLLAPGTVRRETFSHCNSTCLKWTYRRTLIINLLAESKADVICTQECDETFYRSSFEKEMLSRGFASHFKSGGAKHGIALFYRLSLFEEIKYVEVEYAKLSEGRKGLERDELARGNVGQVLALRSKKDSSRGLLVTNTHLFWNWKYEFVKLKQMEMLLSALLQTKLTLEEESERQLKEEEEEANQEERKKKEKTIFAPILGGDFNLCPDSVVYAIITTGKMRSPSDILAFLTPSDHLDDDSNHLDKVVSDGINGWGGYKRPPSAVEDHKRIEEVHKLIQRWNASSSSSSGSYSSGLPLLVSTYGRYTQLGLEGVEAPAHCTWCTEPPHTCFVQWKGTIDYIFLLAPTYFSSSTSSSEESAVKEEEAIAVEMIRRNWDGKDRTDQVRLEKIAELPTEKELSYQVGLPNDFIPSDHIPLMASFSFSSQK